MLAKFVDSFHALRSAHWFVLAEILRKRLCFACVCCLFLASPFAAVAEQPRPNVLFIAVDDLRSQLGCYGYADMKTPNIDRLANSSVLFEHHYVSVPICIPSRAGLLTGTRSERTRQTYGRSVWPKVTGIRTMGRTFGEAGYYTVSLGKIWHTMPGSDNGGESFDVRRPSGDPTYADPQLQHLLGKKDQLPAAEGPLDVPDEAYGDGLIANDAVRELGVGATSGKPFLLMVGFRKPHLPYNAPKKYWDLYDPDHPPGEPDQTELPEGAPALAAREMHELWKYREGFSFANPPAGEAARRLRHAYAACVSYTDALIGKVLAELDRLELRKNTIIVLWSDHGYHLGHLGQWTKLTNYETAANSPLLISAPGLRQGARCALPVETCDLFPTLLDLCGLPPLAVTDGTSLRPLLEDPQSAAWNRVAYHLVNRSGGGRGKPIIGRAVRDTRFRYIEWHEGWEQTDRPVAVELYDYSPGAPGEARNLADDPALTDQRERLHRLLWNWTSQSTITQQ
jgi:iduronate 2-sulfatase